MRITCEKKWQRHLGLLLLYALITFVMTYPVVFRLNQMPLDVTDAEHYWNRDSFVDLWNFWWFKYSIFDLHVQPFFSKYVYYPHGTSLVFLPFTGIYNVVSLPFQWLAHAEGGPIIAYSVIALCSYILAAYGMYLLALEVVGDSSAAFVGGLIYSFCANRLWTLSTLNLFCFEFVVFFVFFLIRLLKSPSLWRGVWAGVFFALLFYSSLSFALFSTAFALILTFAYIVARKFDRAYLKGVAASGCVALASFSLLALPLLLAIRSFFSSGRGEAATMDFMWPVTFSNDLLNFVIPSFKLRFYDLLLDFQFLYSKGIDWRVIGLKSFLGYTALGLAVWGAIKAQARQKWFWLFSFLLFALLSMGPYLHVGGKVYENIPLPYYVLYKWVPFFRVERAPERMIVLVMLPLAVLSAYGVKSAAQSRHLRRGIAVALFSFLVLLENFGAPFKTANLLVPDIYRQMAAEEPDYAILDIPMEVDMIVVGTYFQIVHQKPLIEGQFARHSPGSTDFIEGDAFLRAILEGKLSEYYLSLTADPEREQEMSDTRRKLIENHTKYIFLHTWHMSHGDEEVARKLIGLLGPFEETQTVPYMNGDIVVYRM